MTVDENISEFRNMFFLVDEKIRRKNMFLTDKIARKAFCVGGLFYHIRFLTKISTKPYAFFAILNLIFKELRDRVICAICMDNIMNMVFLCGHGVCQMCGDRCHHCPICRKPIERKILLYCQ